MVSERDDLGCLGAQDAADLQPPRSVLLGSGGGDQSRAFVELQHEGSSFIQAQQTRSQEDAQKQINVKLQKVEAKQRLGASTSEDTGLLFLMVVCSASGHWS